MQITKKVQASFITRIFINAFVIWLAIWIYSPGYLESIGDSLLQKILTFTIASLILSLFNTIVRPLVVLLSLPALILTLGLFTLVINGLILYLVLALTPGITMSFGGAIVTALIMSLINLLITNIFLNKEGK